MKGNWPFSDFHQFNSELSFYLPNQRSLHEGLCVCVLFVNMGHCVFIQHGVCGGARLRLPWCTSSLCLPCESSVRLCLPLSFLSARCLRGKVSLLSLSSTSQRSHSFIHSLKPIVVRWCLYPSFLIRNETPLHSFFLCHLPLCSKIWSPLPDYLVDPAPLWVSLVIVLLSCHICVNLPFLSFLAFFLVQSYGVLHLFFVLPLSFR